MNEVSDFWSTTLFKDRDKILEIIKHFNKENIKETSRSVIGNILIMRVILPEL